MVDDIDRISFPYCVVRISSRHLRGWIAWLPSVKDPMVANVSEKVVFAPDPMYTRLQTCNGLDTILTIKVLAKLIKYRLAGISVTITIRKMTNEIRAG